jgi:glycosyltransferase involved in cell wall biosynthesis
MTHPSVKERFEAGAPAPASDEPVLATVLTPVRDEERHIGEAVARMRRQELDGPYELLFMDGRSSDRTKAILEELAREDPRIRVFDNPGLTTPKGLNVGLRHARGEFVVRMDAHTYYPPGYIAAGVERLRRGDGVEWVNGPQVPLGKGSWSRRVALATESWLGVGGATFRRGAQDELEVDTGFTGAWARATLERLGGWDEEWTINQDAELAERIKASGGRIVCIPAMSAHYIPRDSLRTLARQYFRYGLYRCKTARRHPDSLRRTHVLAPGAAAALAGALVLPPPLSGLARLGVALYGLAILAASIGMARRAGPRDAAAMPAVFATIHLSWGFGFLAGFARWGPPLAALVRLVRRPARAPVADVEPAAAAAEVGS